MAGAGVTLSMLSTALLPNYALAEQVSFNDDSITATYETFASPLGLGEGRGYFVTPKKVDGKLPVVLVIHENRGLNPYIKDVARRLAKAGYIAFAPDILHTLGGYPGNDDEGKVMQKSLDKAKVEQDFIAAAQFLKSHPLSSGKLGAVGFCFGGYIVNMLAATIPEAIDAGVPFYGTPAKAELRKNIKAPLLIQLAENDKRVNAYLAEHEADLKKYNVDYKVYIYENCQHGFHNDSTARYNPEMADLAWQRSLDFFSKNLAMKS
jgi:carboxymethylenebutenolidase